MPLNLGMCTDQVREFFLSTPVLVWVRLGLNILSLVKYKNKKKERRDFHQLLKLFFIINYNMSHNMLKQYSKFNQTNSKNTNINQNKLLK